MTYESKTTQSLNKDNIEIMCASMLYMNIIYDVAVIGGGPAGMMAAGRASERGMRVILLEKNADLGKKLLITGGGRCNITNAEFDNRALLSKFKGSDKFLFSAFSQYSVKETLDFFHSRGMKTKTEEGQRIFPLSNKAESVWKVLIENMKDNVHGGSNPVVIRNNAEVVGFEIFNSVNLGVGSEHQRRMKGACECDWREHEEFPSKEISVPLNSSLVRSVTPPKRASNKIIRAVRLLNGEIIRANSFILATGGKSHPETGSTGDGFEWLAKLGHTISPPFAALVPITVSDQWVKNLSGVSISNAKITLLQNDLKVGGKNQIKRGKILFTHFGLSGPAILNMSSEISELLKYGEVVISLDLLPNHDYSTLNETLQDLFKKQSNKKFKNAITDIIPACFVPVILEKSGITSETFCHSVTREERLVLIKIFKDIRIHPTGILGEDKAIITSGGVALKEIDFRTMRSHIIPNLYLIGDVLNIDRPSGGYSLQLCWTTGWVAGNSVQKDTL